MISALVWVAGGRVGTFPGYSATWHFHLSAQEQPGGSQEAPLGLATRHHHLHRLQVIFTTWLFFLWSNKMYRIYSKYFFFVYLKLNLYLFWDSSNIILLTFIYCNIFCVLNWTLHFCKYASCAFKMVSKDNTRSKCCKVGAFWNGTLVFVNFSAQDASTWKSLCPL